MDSKQLLREQVEIVMMGTGMNQEELALAMNYGKNYISEMLSPTGKVSEKFVSAFRLRYSKYLENPKIDTKIGKPRERDWSNLTESNLKLAEGQLRLIAVIESLNLGELVKASLPVSDSKKDSSPGIAVVPLEDKKLPPRGTAKRKERQKDKV